MIVGLCHGVFDLVHFGHVRHLNAAAAKCDRLVVSVTADQYVNKGPSRPVFPIEHRLEMLRAIGVVDEVVACDYPNAVPILQAVKPQLYFKHIEYQNSTHPGFVAEAAYCRENGISLVFTEADKGSSSEALRRFAMSLR